MLGLEPGYIRKSATSRGETGVGDGFTGWGKPDLGEGVVAVSRKRIERDFPGSSVVKTLHSAKGGTDSTLGWGAKVSYAMRGGWPKKRLGRRGSLGRYYDVLARSEVEEETRSR